MPDDPASSSETASLEASVSSSGAVSSDDVGSPDHAPDEQSLQDRVVSEKIDQAVTHSFRALRQHKLHRARKSVDKTGRTVEELFMEALIPELRKWLDVHLSSTVERIVQREVRRMIHRAEE